DLVAAECAAAPLVLVLEDLHWGDVPTVQFVDAVLRTQRDAPLLVLALARPEIADVFPRLWEERGHVTTLRLTELGKRAAEKLARQCLGDDVEPAVLARIVERAAGNAFYRSE